jgi:ribonuclease Z
LIFQVKILGNNSAVPAHNRNQTSQLLQLDSQYILIDCGEGTQIQLSKMNVRLGRIKTVLISHLHGDHYFGLVGLISTMHLFHRTSKLTIFAPPKLKEIVELQLSASETELCFDLEFTPLAHEGKLKILEEEYFFIEAFPLDHGISCYGFLIREKPKQWRIIKEKLPERILIQEILKLKSGQDVIEHDGTVKYKLNEYTLPPRPSRSYAYCSDTKYDERIVEHIREADLLYHESTFAEDMKDRALLTNHSTASDAAKIARLANVKKLILGHYSTRYSDLTPLIEEARLVFTESYLSHEGETISLKE